MRRSPTPTTRLQRTTSNRPRRDWSQVLEESGDLVRLVPWSASRPGAAGDRRRHRAAHRRRRRPDRVSAMEPPRRRWQVVLVIAAALVVATVVSQSVGGLLNSPSPPVVGPASCYDTSGDGTAAFAQLLRDRLHPLRQLTIPIRDASLPAGATVFVLDPASGLAGDLPAMRRILAGGGRLVLGGPSATSRSVLQSLVAAGGAATAGHQPGDISAAGALPVWRPEASGIAHPATAFSRGARRVERAGRLERLLLAPRPHHLGSTSSSRAAAARSRMVAELGGGTVVLLASSEPLQNSGARQSRRRRLRPRSRRSTGEDRSPSTSTTTEPAGPVPAWPDCRDIGRQPSRSHWWRSSCGYWEHPADSGLPNWLNVSSSRHGSPTSTRWRRCSPPARRAASPRARPRCSSAARERLCRRVRAEPAASDSELRLRAADEGLPAGVGRCLAAAARERRRARVARAGRRRQSTKTAGAAWPRLPEGHEE